MGESHVWNAQRCFDVMRGALQARNMIITQAHRPLCENEADCFEAVNKANPSSDRICVSLLEDERIALGVRLEGDTRCDTIRRQMLEKRDNLRGHAMKNISAGDFLENRTGDLQSILYYGTIIRPQSLVPTITNLLADELVQMFCYCSRVHFEPQRVA